MVHGLWMHGVVFHFLRRALMRCGFRVETFSYPSVRRGLAANTDRLAHFVAGRDAEKVHLVGHSLGGLLILNLLSRPAVPPIGRAVLMGTPCRGSHCAAMLAGIPGCARIVGHSMQDWRGVTSPLAAGVEIGVIAGDRGVGTGPLLFGLPQPNDGIVAVAETQLAEATDSLTLHVAHSEMLFSKACARQVAAFLATGRFLHDGDERP
ncbi:esterase/lipase family protein [Aromatoleum anaerobium]|nr:alpha/beta fold hydrolase [Aromatoleum anaerobium]